MGSSIALHQMHLLGLKTACNLDFGALVSYLRYVNQRIPISQTTIHAHESDSTNLRILCGVESDGDRGCILLQVGDVARLGDGYHLLMAGDPVEHDLRRSHVVLPESRFGH